MKFFNRYFKDERFRWIGFNIFKITFAFGFSFGKPIWYIPYVEFIFNDKHKRHLIPLILSVSFGWLLFCFRIQIVYGVEYNGN